MTGFQFVCVPFYLPFYQFVFLCLYLSICLSISLFLYAEIIIKINVMLLFHIHENKYARENGVIWVYVWPFCCSDGALDAREW